MALSLQEGAKYFCLQAMGEQGFRGSEVDGSLKCMPFERDKDTKVNWNL